MVWLLLAVALVASFGLVVFIGPPYLPTLNRQVEVALDLLELKPGQELLELGCGDGRVLIAAARRGICVTGIELNPFLVTICWLRTRRFRKLVKVRLGDYWSTRHWGEADAIFGFVLPKYMAKLDRLVETWRNGRPVRLASFAFKVPDRVAVKERDGVLLYEYK